MTKRRHKGAGSARSLLSQAVALVGESHALSYALVIALAATPRERFSHKEIDALCQVAYELQKSSQRRSRCFRRWRKLPIPSRGEQNPAPRAVTTTDLGYNLGRGRTRNGVRQHLNDGVAGARLLAYKSAALLFVAAPWPPRVRGEVSLRPLPTALTRQELRRRAAARPPPSSAATVCLASSPVWALRCEP
jgi:hypothetical protein